MSRNGFTLMEVMVALMILASVTLSLSYSAKTIMHSRHVAEQKLADVMRTKSIIESLSAIKFEELAGMNDRSINDKKVFVRFISNDLLNVKVGDIFAITTLRSRYN